MNHSILQRVLREVEGLSADAESDAGLLQRFAKSRDEPAFTELLRRHGPMVWAVCRHLLPGHADAEDAFQATFLALVRSAQSIRDGNAVSGWLHGVAVKIATRVKRSAVRRKQREQRSAVPEADRTVPEATWQSLLAAVHEEVQSLPGPLRTAFVLCDLEGVRQPDAAARLGWKPGTLTGRLSRARQLLLERLEGRGLAPLLAGGSAGLGVATAAAAVPLSLIDRVVSLTIAGGSVPPAVLNLVREVMPMALNRTKLAAAAVLVAGGLAAGLGPVVWPLAMAQPPGSPDAASAAPFGSEYTGSPPASGAAAAPAPEGPVTPGASPYGLESVPGMEDGGGYGMAIRQPRVEYRYVGMPDAATRFVAMLNEEAAKGWEYVGQVEFGAGEWQKVKGSPNQLAGIGPRTTTVAVFKRSPRTTTARSSAGAGFGMPGAMPPGAVPGAPGMVPGGLGGGRGGRRSGGGGGEGLPGGSSDGGMLSLPLGSATSDPFGTTPPPAHEVIRLRSGKAEEVAKVLSEVYRDRAAGFRVVAEPTSNSIIVIASERDLVSAKQLLEQLKELTPAPKR